MHQARVFAVSLALLAILAMGCGSVSNAPTDDLTSSVAPATTSTEAATAEADTPAPVEPAPTEPPGGSLSGVTFSVSTAEELDRVQLVGLDASVEADELAVLATFEGQDVEFEVHEDAAGLHFYAPLNPASPGSDGLIELRVSRGTETGPPLELALTGLPPAPGAAAAFASELRIHVDALARAEGTSFEELQTMSMEETPDEFFMLKLMQDIVDDGTENDLTSALGADGTELSADEVALLDSLVDKLAPETAMRRMPPPPMPPTGDAAPETDTGPTVLPRENPRPGAGACISNPPAITTAQQLSEALEYGKQADVRLGGEALANKASNGFGWGSIVPVVGQVSAGLSLLITADTIEDKTIRGRYPSSVSDLTAVLTPTELNADYEEAGSWSDVRVTAKSKGYDSAIDVVKFLYDAGTAPLGGAGDLAGKFGKNTAIRLLQDSVQGTRSFCPHSWNVDVSGLPWTSARSTEGGLAVDNEAQTFSPTELGVTQLRITLNRSLFSFLDVSENFDVTTQKTRLEVVPQQVEVRFPGELVELDITFENSDTELAKWTTEQGEFLDESAESQGETKRFLRTPDSPDAYPFDVSAEFSGTTGLYGLQFPPPRALDTVEITLADLFVDPAEATIPPNSQLQYTATNRDGNPVEVTWSATGGSISTDGLYTAGVRTGSFTVTAVAEDGSDLAATVPVHIVECDLVGTWSLRLAPFIANIGEIGGGQATYISGQSIMTLSGDGTFTSQRIGLTLEASAGGQTARLIIDSTESGTWDDSEGGISINESASNATVQMAIPGVGTMAAPVDAPNGFSGIGTYTCSGNTLQVTIDGLTTTHDRVG